MAENKLNTAILDGSLEEQKRCVEEYLSTLSEEDHTRAMSSEFDYLDEEYEE